MSPLTQSTRVDRDDIFMGHQYDGLQRGVRAGPGVKVGMGVDVGMGKGVVAVVCGLGASKELFFGVNNEQRRTSRMLGRNRQQDQDGTHTRGYSA
jgi:hypothetical protein